MQEKNKLNDYRTDFQRGLDALEDIQLLSEFSVSPLVSNAYFYLSEMKRKADAANQGKLDQNAHVKQVLESKLTDIFADFFGQKNRFKGHELKKSTHRLDLAKWNLLFDVIPEVLSVVSLFRYHGIVDVNLNESRLSISGLVLEDKNLELGRKFIYVVTRKLLRKEVLLTFKFDETGRTGLFKLDLEVDISHDSNYSYNVTLASDEKEQYQLRFTNILMNYRSNYSEIAKVGEHTIVDIGADLSLVSYQGLPDLKTTEYNNKEILHFSFLFRPVSIILPVKGKIIKETFEIGLEDSNKRQQDVSKHIRKIDFFSLFNI